MAGVTTDHSGMNVELNLVPFIDLLSTLTLFLLVTAVWLQVSAIQAAVDSKGKSAVSQSEQKRLTVRVTASGYQLTWPGTVHGMPTSIPRGAAEKLTAAMKRVGSAKLSATAIAGNDDVPYSAVVEAVDAAKSAGVGAVGLSTE